MNPFDLTTSDMLIWGIVAHLIADWPLQNDWMARFKAMRYVTRSGRSWWWLRQPAAYVHASIHLACLSLVFGVAAFALAVVHLLIDTRWPVEKWSKLIGQTQPSGRYVDLGYMEIKGKEHKVIDVVYDVGTEVRFWTDQVFHIACIAIAALLVAL